MAEPPTRAKIHEYWNWIGAALFLLITVDMLTTIYAAAVVGPGAESNPLMRWALRQGIGVIVAVNLLAAVVVGGLCYGLVRALRRTAPERQPVFALVIELWIGLLLFVGLFVLANNLSVVVHGRSLL